MRPDELRRMLGEQAGLDLAALVPADGGESASTFLATGQDGTVSVLKISPNATADAAGRLRELVAGLRRRGYPAARLLGSGQVAGMTFWRQERLPGTVLGQAPDTRDLLDLVRRTADRCLPALPEGGDFVHYDFTLANLLTSGSGVSGVIDINPPALTGDRAFDLAAMLFYVYEHDGIREGLRRRALELTDPRALDAYLAHMLLRQVDWSLRHHPGAPATAYHLRLARLVAADLEAGFTGRR